MELKIISVVGAGQMGRGIAQVCAQSGFCVQLYDENTPQLHKSLDFIKNQWNKGVEKNKWDTNHVQTWMQNLKILEGNQEWEMGLAKSDVVIEAIVENFQAKAKLFETLDKFAKKEAILCSNTSSISITKLAACTQRPSQVIGMHFMNPVPVMKLVEGIVGLQTSEQTLQIIKNLCEKLSKTFVQALDIPGFAVNRILMPMINEAIYVLYEGIASIADIDTAMKLGTNVPMGPLQLADFIGLDTCLAIMEVLYEGLGDTKYRPCPLLKQYVAAKRLGQKTKRGFYEY